MRKYLIFLLFVSCLTYGQNSNFRRFDFSQALMLNKDYGCDGLFDSACYRIQIHFGSIVKDSIDPRIYHISGEDRLKKYITPFHGYVKINKIIAHKGNVYDPDKPDKVRLVEVFGEYKFNEIDTIKNSGYFFGNLYFKVHLLQSGKIVDDLEEWEVDGFSNDIFDGFWVNYRTNKKKVCIWGFGRYTKFNNALQGDGEVMINPKFEKNGWQMDKFGYYIDDPKKWWLKNKDGKKVK